MLDFMKDVPVIPLADWTKNFTDWLTDTFSFLFDPIKENLTVFMEFVSEKLIAVPPIIIIVVIALLAFFVSGKKLGLPIFSIVG